MAVLDPLFFFRPRCLRSLWRTREEMQSSADSSVTCLARVDCDGPTARRLADALAEVCADAAVAAFERPDGTWSVEAHFAQAPDEASLRDLVGTVAGAQAVRELVIETVAARDWVAASLAGLKPVAAGRFLIHGSHDRARIPGHRIGIEIEAALAFGTGHHGTTRGCLLAFDAYLKGRHMRLAPSLAFGHCACTPSPRSCGERVGVRGADFQRSTSPATTRGDAPSPRPSPRTRGEGAPTLWEAKCDRLARTRGKGNLRILDIGTGTGVLAIAAAKALRVRVIASDIDARAAEVARANARTNAVGSLVEVVHAGGLAARRLRERGPYDLVFANILLAPLKRLAAPIARVLAPNARVILSGLLAAQAPAAIAAYRAQGLVFESCIPLDEWVTLVLGR
jgi:ribosomal protein L11 methylase PrmA